MPKVLWSLMVPERPLKFAFKMILTFVFKYEKNARRVNILKGFNTNSLISHLMYLKQIINSI